MTMCKDLGFDTLALSETHKWRSDTHAIFSEQPEDGDKMELAGTRPTHAIAPPGAPSPVKLRQTYSRDAFRRRT